MRNQKMFDVLKSAVDKAKNGTPAQNQDEGLYWKMEADKAGNASSVIRFLPAKDDESVPFVKIYTHGFQGPTSKWFIENCPTTIGQDCPACQANGVLWNSGKESDKEIVRKRKRKVSYISNVLVVSDPKNPDNEGKVFLFKYGQKIFDKIFDKINPQFDDESPMNPFDPVEGANFKLKMRRVEGYANFDKSEFAEPEAIGSEKEIAALVNQVHDLNQFTDPKAFKSFDDLQKRLDGALGNTVTTKARKPDVSDEDDDKEFVATVKKTAAAPKKETEDEEDMAYFARLAESD